MVIREAAAQSTSLGWLLGAMTIVFLGVFTAWTAWAYNPRRRAALDAAARLPLEDQ